jgi:hypothetical protein
LSELSNVVFEVTFTDQFSTQMLDDFFATGFLRAGEVRRTTNPRVMRLHMFRQEYLATKSFLDELRDGGGLTYIEELSDGNAL